MLMKAQSRQAKRNQRLTKDPDGPHMHRLDTYIHDSPWQMFVSLRDSGNWTQPQALEFALKLAFVFKVLEGKISAERLVDACLKMSRKEKGRAAEPEEHAGKDSEAGEPELVE